MHSDLLQNSNTPKRSKVACVWAVVLFDRLMSRVKQAANKTSQVFVLTTHAQFIVHRGPAVDNCIAK
jgi:hypothetical protein